MSNVVRYGLVSTARIGFSAHLPGAKTSSNSEIVAVSSRSLDSAKAAAKEHDIPLAFGSYQEMIDSDEIDAVVNTLPNSMHHEWTIKAAEAGKHILCEKPLSATMKEAEEMVAAAKANGVVLVEGFTPRWNKQMQTIRKLIAERRVGEIIRVDTCLTFPLANSEDIRMKKSLAGGSMMDAGGYAVYAARFAMGAEPVRATAFERKANGCEVDTTLNGQLEFPGGAVANVWSSLEAPRNASFTATGTNGTIYVEHTFLEDQPVIVVCDGEEEVLEMQSVDRFQAQFNEFSNCVLTGKAPEYPAEDGMLNMAAILALYEAAHSGQTVKIAAI